MANPFHQRERQTFNTGGAIVPCQMRYQCPHDAAMMILTSRGRTLGVTVTSSLEDLRNGVLYEAREEFARRLGMTAQAYRRLLARDPAVATPPGDRLPPA